MQASNSSIEDPGIHLEQQRLISKAGRRGGRGLIEKENQYTGGAEVIFLFLARRDLFRNNKESGRSEWCCCLHNCILLLHLYSRLPLGIQIDQLSALVVYVASLNLEKQ